MIEKVISSQYFWCSFVCFLGLIFLGVALIIKMVSKRKKSRCTVKTQGTIVANKLIDESWIGLDDIDRQYGYYSKVSYYAFDKQYTFRSNIHGSKPLHKVGDIVTVCYNPKKPEQFFIEEEQYILKLIQYIFAAVGVFIIIIGLVLAVAFSF